MQLPRRAVANHHFRVGDVVVARPPTVREVLRGIVVEVQRFTLTLETDSAWIAVDVEDCVHTPACKAGKG